MKSFSPKGAKVMVVGSKLDDVLAISIPTKQDLSEEAASTANKESLSQQKIHRKVLDKGMPEDAMPGILGSKVCSFKLVNTMALSELLVN